MTENTAPTTSGLLGSETKSDYRIDPVVIGSIEQSGAGNSILRIGTLRRAEGAWSQTEHLVLTPAERERLISELVAQRETAPAPTPYRDATEELMEQMDRPVIAGAEAYVDLLTVPAITYAELSEPMDGISDIADFIGASDTYPGSLFGKVHGLPFDPNPVPVGVIDLSVEDQPCPAAIDPAHWHHIVSAAATGRMTGSVGAKADLSDPTGDFEYAITFRTKVSDDRWKITSTTPVGDITMRRLYPSVVVNGRYQDSIAKILFEDDEDGGYPCPPNIDPGHWTRIVEDATARLRDGKGESVTQVEVDGKTVEYHVHLRAEAYGHGGMKVRMVGDVAWVVV